jgi:cell wall-associated NlpC family hydrolase
MTILVLEAGEEWSNIRTEHGLRGYMHNDLFGPDKPADEITELETGRYKYVDTEVANLREEPSTDSEIIGAAFMDDRLYQISDNGGWSKVRTEGGVIAYVFNHLLRDTPPANPFVKTNRTLYVASDQVNVRSSPTTDSDVIDRVKINQAVTELEANDTWSKIKLDNNKTGFIRSDLLTNIKPPPEGFTKSSGSVYVSTGAANIRSEPNTSCAIVIVVRLGEQLTSLATGPDWTMIRTSGGKTGYISNDLISKTKPSSGSSSSSSSSSGGSSSGSSGSGQTGSSGSAANSDSRQRVVDIAKSALGVPYRMSGRSMSAFDCSGLVKYTYEAIGYKNIPHGSDPQARQLGTKVSISGRDFSNLLPGDLLFFSRGSGYHHVGIYIGDNKMIHASSANGGVITTDLMNYPAPARVNRVLD